MIFKKGKHLLKLLSFYFISDVHQGIFLNLQEQKEKSKKNPSQLLPIFVWGTYIQETFFYLSVKIFDGPMRGLLSKEHLSQSRTRA